MCVSAVQASPAAAEPSCAEVRSTGDSWRSILALVLARSIQLMRPVVVGVSVLAAAAVAPEVTADNLKAQLSRQAAHARPSPPASNPASPSVRSVPQQSDLHSRWGGGELDLRWFKPGPQTADLKNLSCAACSAPRPMAPTLPAPTRVGRTVCTAWPHGPPVLI